MSYHICSLENTVFHMDDCKRSFKLFLLVTENPQPIFNISRIVAYLKHITICQLILEIETNKTILKFFVTKLPVTCGPKIYNKRQWITYVSEATPLTMAHSWLFGSKIADQKNVESMCSAHASTFADKPYNCQAHQKVFLLRNLRRAAA